MTKEYYPGSCEEKRAKLEKIMKNSPEHVRKNLEDLAEKETKEGRDLTENKLKNYEKIVSYYEKGIFTEEDCPNTTVILYTPDPAQFLEQEIEKRIH